MTCTLKDKVVDQKLVEQQNDVGNSLVFQRVLKKKGCWQHLVSGLYNIAKHAAEYAYQELFLIICLTSKCLKIGKQLKFETNFQ